jgi:hypothetical protein
LAGAKAQVNEMCGLDGPAEAMPLLQSPVRGIFLQAVKSWPSKATWRVGETGRAGLLRPVRLLD